jgi:hypothetical protein
MTETEIHLRIAPSLFRRTKPPQNKYRHGLDPGIQSLLD